MPRIHLWMSILGLLNNDTVSSLKAVDSECVMTQDIPDYLSEDIQGWILYLCWLCGIKLPQMPSKEFPSQRETTGFSFFAESASHAHLLPQRECIRGCQGKAHTVKSLRCQGCGASRYTDHPKPGRSLVSQSVLVMLCKELALSPRSKRGFTPTSGPVIW